MGNYLNRSVIELIAKRENLIDQVNLLIRTRAALGIEQESKPLKDIAKEYYEDMESIYQKISEELSEIRKERATVSGELEKLLKILSGSELAPYMLNEAPTDCAKNLTAPPIMTDYSKFGDESSVYSYCKPFCICAAASHLLSSILSSC